MYVCIYACDCSEREQKGGGERDREINIKNISNTHHSSIKIRNKPKLTGPECFRRRPTIAPSVSFELQRDFFFSHKQGCIACRNRRISMLTYVK